MLQGVQLTGRYTTRSALMRWSVAVCLPTRSDADGVTFYSACLSRKSREAVVISFSEAVARWRRYCTPHPTQYGVTKSCSTLVILHWNPLIAKCGCGFCGCHGHCQRRVQSMRDNALCAVQLPSAMLAVLYASALQSTKAQSDDAHVSCETRWIATRPLDFSPGGLLTCADSVTCPPHHQLFVL